MKMKIAGLIGATLLAFTLGACDASNQEARQTYRNRQAINQTQPIPELGFSMRRFTLIKYYESLGQPRLLTCTYAAGRGSFGEAIFPSYGFAVNLSNQTTAPGMAEADSIYAGPNDQSIVILRNGNVFNAEMDAVSVMGECPEERSTSLLQRMVDHAATQEPEIQFLPSESVVP